VRDRKTSSRWPWAKDLRYWNQCPTRILFCQRLSKCWVPSRGLSGSGVLRKPARNLNCLPNYSSRTLPLSQPTRKDRLRIQQIRLQGGSCMVHWEEVVVAWTEALFRDWLQGLRKCSTKPSLTFMALSRHKVTVGPRCVLTSTDASISSASCFRKVHQHCYCSILPALSQFNSIHTLTHYLFNSIYLGQGSISGLLSSGFHLPQTSSSPTEGRP
jgi:hypothetical protein